MTTRRAIHVYFFVAMKKRMFVEKKLGPLGWVITFRLPVQMYDAERARMGWWNSMTTSRLDDFMLGYEHDVIYRKVVEWWIRKEEACVASGRRY